jgi:hypothetical protein
VHRRASRAPPARSRISASAVKDQPEGAERFLHADDCIQEVPGVLATEIELATGPAT